MDPIRWLMRGRFWLRNPPSERQVLLVLGVIAVCAAIVAAEKLGLWPDWATMERGSTWRLPR